MRKLVGLAVCIGAVACSGDASKRPAADTGLVLPGAAGGPAGSGFVAAASVHDTSGLTLEENGIAAARVGLTLEELNADLHESMKAQGSCAILHSSKFPAGVTIMVLKDTIQRVDVDSAGVVTPEGYGVGSEEGAIVAALRRRLTILPHKYEPKGHYLVLPGANDSTHRIIFETDGRVVTHMRAGTRPAVDQVEKCG